MAVTLQSNPFCLHVESLFYSSSFYTFPHLYFYRSAFKALIGQLFPSSQVLCVCRFK